ncbi:MAG: chromate transporter [Burkholderiales bacterium]|nr:MAG: chromate transporter [Burkholderiales bacterium]
MSWSDWLELFGHFALLSLLAVGGAITTAADMHRYLVHQNGWISDAQFTSSIALSQAAPGPNVLFVALLGWNVGLNAGGGPSGGWMAWSLALLGVLVTMVAILLPSSVLSYAASRWAHRHRERHGVRAFKAGMAPIVIALLMATGWLLISAHHDASADWRLWLLMAATTALVWRTRVHLLVPIALGALLGAAGLV